MLIFSTQSNSGVELGLGFHLRNDYLHVILCAQLCVNKLEILLKLLPSLVLKLWFSNTFKFT
jgi:hypothetical protein